MDELWPEQLQSVFYSDKIDILSASLYETATKRKRVSSALEGGDGGDGAEAEATAMDDDDWKLLEKAKQSEHAAEYQRQQDGTKRDFVVHEIGKKGDGGGEQMQKQESEIQNSLLNYYRNALQQ